jgi:alkylhydroperoxidase family enzyme
VSVTTQISPRRVSRLPALPDPLPPEVQALFDERLKHTGRILNIHHTFGHAPKLSRASMMMALGLRANTAVPRRYIELAIVRAAQNARGKYELQQHKPMLLAQGYSPKKYHALAKWRSSKLFDDKERALLAYTDQVTKFGDVSDKTFKAMERHFSAPEIMELTFAIGNYYGTALIMNALKIKLEKKK